MEVVSSAARAVRGQYRHELRTLTYVTLDQANGGIVRNLTHSGIGVQAVAALRPGQEVRVRFELRQPRLRLETRGKVMWSTASGQCGIRFLDLPARLTRQLGEWIFGNLLDGISLHPERVAAMFPEHSQLDDGLLLSAAPRPPIPFPFSRESSNKEVNSARVQAIEDWLSQPLSGRSLVWAVNSLVLTASILLFAVVFLSVTREAPPWPGRTAVAGAIVVAVLFWGFFKVFGGETPGTRLAKLASIEEARHPAELDSAE